MSTKLSSCCLTGHLHSGTPEGKDGEIAGVPSYVTGSGNASILFITDIFGYKLSNVRLLADEYAKTGGFKVVIPDFFNGDHVNSSHMKTLTPLKSDPEVVESEKQAKMQVAFGEVGPWLEKHGDDKVQPLIEKVVAELTASGGKVGVVGFCWGGRQAVHLAKDASKVQAVVANHPSYTEMAAFDNVSVPTLVQCGDDDQLFPIEQVNQVKDSIFPNKSGSEIIIYSGAVHGFTVRSDQNNKEETDLKDEASRRAIQFLKQNL